MNIRLKKDHNEFEVMLAWTGLIVTIGSGIAFILSFIGIPNHGWIFITLFAFNIGLFVVFQFFGRNYEFVKKERSKIRR